MKKTFLRRTICLFIAFVMLAVSFTLPAAAEEDQKFSDVPEDHWAYFYIQQCCERNILNGYPVTDDSSLPEFKPDGNVKLGELLKMACLMVWPDYEYRPKDSDTHWAQPYQRTIGVGLPRINYMKVEELDREATRGEAAMIIVEALRIIDYNYEYVKGTEYLKDFKDADSIDAIEEKKIVGSANTLVKLGILEGFPDGTLGLEKNLTRAQVSKLVYIALHDHTNWW